MAQLDVEEQEQLDQIKAYWRRYGNFTLLLIVAVLGTFLGWNQWQKYQQHEAIQASAMYDELDQAVEARDLSRASQVFADLKKQYPQTLLAQQGAMLVAKLQVESTQYESARQTLAWLLSHAITDEYKSLASLRLAAVLIELKKYDEALSVLEASPSKAFEGLVADRRGDVLLALNQPSRAADAYQQAWQMLDRQLDYRRFVEAKLAALGVVAAQGSPTSPVAPAASYEVGPSQ